MFEDGVTDGTQKLGKVVLEACHGFSRCHN